MRGAGADYVPILLTRRTRDHTGMMTAEAAAATAAAAAARAAAARAGIKLDGTGREEKRCI